jgi:hypothetical protein
MIVTDLQAKQPATCAIDLPVVLGSDEITIDTAELKLAAVARALDRTPSSTAPLTFTEPVRLRQLVVNAAVNFAGADPDRLVVGPASGGPVYAHPSFDVGLYGAVLGGMSISSDGNEHTLTFPPLTASAFNVHVAKGGSPTELKHTGDVAIHRAGIDAAPTALNVAMRVGGAEAPVWSHGGTLLPGPEQEIAFLPVAERLLKTPPAAPPDASLVFTSDSDGRISIPDFSIAATYVARPADQPRRIALRGGWERVPLDAPAGAAPTSSALTLTARFLGRALNGASPIASGDSPATSLRFDNARAVAVLAGFAPLAGSPAGSTLGLAAVRLFLAALSDAEVVIELRANAGGAPGAPIVPQSAMRLAVGELGWREVVLAPPAPSIATGDTAVWVVVRATKGSVLWCGDAGGARAPLVSTDGMATWSDVMPIAPRLQLFHAAVAPPSIDVQLRAGNFAHQWTLAPSSAGSSDFTSGATSFPPSLHALLQTKQAANGNGRAVTPLELFSPFAADLTLDGIALSYRVAATLRKN